MEQGGRRTRRATHAMCPARGERARAPRLFGMGPQRPAFLAPLGGGHSAAPLPVYGREDERRSAAARVSLRARRRGRALSARERAAHARWKAGGDVVGGAGVLFATTDTPPTPK